MRVVSANAATAALLAERIGATCADAILDWGEAIRAAKADPENKALESVAKACGARAAELGLGLVKTLRPVKR